MKYFIMITMLFLLGACSSIPEIPDGPQALIEYDPPKWVIAGGGAYTDGKGKAFYGVGSATGIKNYSLQRMVADDRARNDLSKVFEYYTKSLAKDYQAHTTGGDFATSTEEQNSETSIKTVTANVLRGVVIIDHYEIPARNEFLSLARLDYDAFETNIERLDTFQELPEKVQKGIKERADKLHKEMEEETQKLLQQKSYFDNN